MIVEKNSLRLQQVTRFSPNGQSCTSVDKRYNKRPQDCDGDAPVPCLTTRKLEIVCKFDNPTACYHRLLGWDEIARTIKSTCP